MFIGQKVICIKTHSRGIVKKGRIYIIRNIKNNPCCYYKVVDVGIKTHLVIEICWKCRKDHYDPSGIYWLGINLFRPLEEEKGTSYVEDYIEQPVYESLLKDKQ